MKFPILVSYAYARKHEDNFIQMSSNPNVDLLIDSGAFTAKNAGEQILLDDYCKFLDRHKSRIFRYLALDVVGDPKATDANLNEMIKRGYKPVPVHVLGDDQRRMDQLFEMSDYVACAGLRRPNKGGAPREYVQAKMQWANGRPVHWLGYVREPMIASFKPYSCDSASWKSAGLYGRMDVYLGFGNWVNYQYKDVPKLLANKQAMRIVHQCGFNVEQLTDSFYWKSSKRDGYEPDQFVSFAVTSNSWVRYVLDVFARYGTRIFLATTLIEHDMIFLLRWIDKYKFRLEDQ